MTCDVSDVRGETERKCERVGVDTKATGVVMIPFSRQFNFAWNKWALQKPKLPSMKLVFHLLWNKELLRNGLQVANQTIRSQHLPKNKLCTKTK